MRLEKALARVKSMVQYPEARDQYSRLLTVVTKLQDSQVFFFFLFYPGFYFIEGSPGIINKIQINALFIV